MYTDCTEQCRSVQHGEIITSAITKRGVSDADLCAYLKYTCCRCECVLDSCNRSALHLAASCGRSFLVKWLISNRKSDINLRDKESGYTPLHRSIFYGKIHIAVELMKLGASLDLTDLNGLTALEHAMQDGLKPSEHFGELYSWGSNANNLFGTHHNRNSPNLLDTFHRTYSNEYVKHICMDQFHIVIVTNSGKIFSCGHGRGGRLGLKNENSFTIPVIVELQNNKNKEVISCINASISKDHSIFLASDGNIYTCGLNTYRVLGHAPPPEKLLSPKPIHSLSKEISGIIACQYHSLAWGPDVLYVWGLNVGQLGNKTNINNDYFLINPKAINVLSEMNLIYVAASNGAIVFCTKKGQLYILHEFKCKKVANKLTNVIQISVIGGKLDSPLLQNELYQETQHEFVVAVLTNVGNILLWQESDQQICRCIFNINRAVIVKQIHLNLKELLLVSDFGEVFKGAIKPRKKKTVENNTKSNEKSAFHKFLDKDECITIALQKVPKLQRAIFVQSDQKGKDYCVIQANPYTTLFKNIEEEQQMKFDLQILLESSDLHDEIHDLVIKLENNIFAVHKFILFSRCPHFQTLLNNELDNTLILKDVLPEIFREFLQFVYTGTSDLLICGELKNERLRALCTVDEEVKDSNRKNYNTTDPLRTLHQIAKKFECIPLQEHLSMLYMDGYVIMNKKDYIHDLPITFRRLDFLNLCDVTIKCAGKEKFQAHKCILSSRLDYFNNMFSTRWNDNRVAEVTLPFPKAVVEIFLEYLYTDSVSHVENVDVDNLFKTIILADQFFVTRLKMKCEILLSQLLTLKNTVQILSFANLYNATTLKYRCKMFITLNMPTFLEMEYLKDLDVTLLEEISQFYFENKMEMWCRVITPYSIAVSDETILSISSQLTVSDLEEVIKKPTPKKKSRVRRGNNNSISENEDAAFIENMRLSNNPDLDKEITGNYTQQYGIVEEEKFSNIHEPFNIASSPDVSFSHSDFPDLGSSFSSIEGSTPRQKRHRKIRMPPREKLSSITSDSCASSPDVKVIGWKINTEQLSPLEPFSITNIISEEKQQKQNLIKLSNKLLIFTQMEDQAIDELAKFYNTQNITDELIEIERIKIPSGNSSWISNAK